MLTITTTTLDLFTPRALPGITWRVERLDWRAIGGPYRAVLSASASGGTAALWPLADLLRCGITIHDEAGAPCWWGWISAVTLVDAGGAGLRVSLDELATRAAVRYHAPAPLAYAGRAITTEWAEHEPGRRVYGLRERLFSGGQMGEAEALALRGALLERHARPAPQPVLRGGADGPCAVVEARGWWDTLRWTFYHEPRGWTGHMQHGAALSLASGASDAVYAQSFTVGAGAGWLASEVWLRARRARAADAIFARVCADDNGQPGDVLAEAGLPAADLPDELEWVRFPLDPPLALAGDSVYWIAVLRGGAPDPAAYYVLSADESAGYPDGRLLVGSGGQWLPRVPESDLNFVVGGVEDSAEQIARMLRSAQFLTGARVDPPATHILARLHRDGTRRLEAEIQDMLDAGDGGGRRLLARVEPNRLARVTACPAPGSAALVAGPGGTICRADGRPLALSQAPVGQWARLGRAALPRYPQPVFVEKVTWTPAGGMRMET